MRKLAIAMALASTALATPAVARDKSWYVGVEGGVMLVEDTQLNYTIDDGVNPPTETKDAINIDHKMGLDVDLIAGYDFGRFRLEAELGYKRASIKDLDFSTDFTSPYAYYYIDSVDSGGNLRVLSAMANFLLDFGDDDNWSGFAGLGAGIADVRYKVSADFTGYSEYTDQVDYYDTSVSESASKFAWQVVAGVRKAISPNLDLGLKYRFFNVQHLNFEDDADGIFEGRIRTHSLLASLVYNFAPPPPPPADPVPIPEPVPTPPATQVCPNGSTILATETCPAPVAVQPGPFMVFFDWDKDEITPQAAAILDNAASAYASAGQAQVMLAGHADRSGSDQYNVGLSQRRAANVRAYLAGRGIPDGVMTTEAFGESRPLVDTADGVREPQNRRVEITYGPGSGW